MSMASDPIERQNPKVDATAYEIWVPTQLDDDIKARVLLRQAIRLINHDTWELYDILKEEAERMIKNLDAREGQSDGS